MGARADYTPAAAPVNPSPSEQIRLQQFLRRNPVKGALPQGPPEGAHPVIFHAVDADATRTLFPGSRPFPIATLTGNAGDLLLAAWRRVPIEVLTVHGDPSQAAAMIGLITLE